MAPPPPPPQPPPPPGTPLPAEAVAATLAAVAPAGPAALRASSRPDGAALVVAALHACVVGAGFQPAAGRTLPAGWCGGRDAVEWVFDYTCPGKAHAFQLHASLQAATGRLLVHFRELLPPRPPGAGAVLAMAAVGGGAADAASPGPALPGVGASAFLGASVSRYVAAEEGENGGDVTDPVAAWTAATANLGALAAMVGDHLTGPVSAAAEPGECPASERRAHGEAGASPRPPSWPASPATLALGVAVLAVGVGVALTLHKGGGGRGGRVRRW